MLVSVAAQSLQGHAQAVSRVKARLLSVNGQVLTLELAPGEDGTAADHPSHAKAPASQSSSPTGARVKVTFLPSTKIVFAKDASLDALKVGDYAGAVVSEDRKGTLRARQVYLYSDPLRGTGEGRFFDFGRLLINGTVSAIDLPNNGSSGTLTIHYRGADWTTENGGRAICQGRAAPPALVSPLACSNDARISIPSDVPVSQMVVGNSGLLVPGAMLSVSILKADGKELSPGIVVEKPQ